MKEELQRLVDKFGWFIIVRVLAYPVTTLVMTPVRFFQTLWSARILAAGKWSDYNRFAVTNGINSLFYWTQAKNLDYFGRGGVSPFLGLGECQLGQWFQVTLVSSYFYFCAGAVLPLLSMFGWWGMHFFWLESVPFWWGALILVVALFSTKFYAGAFGYLNYNALGWMFFPLGLWGWVTGQYWIACVAWFAASFGSFTVVFIASILAVAYSCQEMTWLPLLSVMPAGCKLLTHFLWSTRTGGNVWGCLNPVLKLIGFQKINVKYRRKRNLLNIRHVYFFLLYFQFGLVYWWISGQLPILWGAGVALYLVNTMVARFADEQSLYMTMFGLAVALMMQQVDLMLLPSFWLVISPLPLMLGFKSVAAPPDIPPALAPFRVRGLIDSMSDFLAPVTSGKRVLMAFTDPENCYEKIFDGYRVLLELPIFVSTLKKVHFLPSWWAVMETNYEGAPNIWGRRVDEVLENVSRWKVDHVIVYQDSGSVLDGCWAGIGFEAVSVFDWAEYAEDLRHETPWSGPTPKWWLLKVPSCSKHVFNSVSVVNSHG
ncbi:MAG: hypothetical protein KKH22_10445 [Proteobacteria bacterium]|nr:hypothetical protein [Pseudomonadota bacterium]